MTRKEPVGVMVVEDSATVREYLVGLFSSQPDLRIAATARNGQRALDMLKTIPRPGIITMDIHMPVMDGLKATQAIMSSYPAPILVVSSGPEAVEGSLVFKAMEAGALGAVRLPPGDPDSPERREAEHRLLESVRTLSEVKVVRRWEGGVPARGADGRASGVLRYAAETGVPAEAASRILSRTLSVPAPFLDSDTAVPLPSGPPQMVAVGASTGGPMAIRDLLKAMHPGFPLPVLVVQHMAAGFIQSFADWLGEDTGMDVKIGKEGMALRPGAVIIAPEGRHMEVTPERTVRLAPAGKKDLHAPSVARLFSSVESVYGPTAIAALLTGMGSDGAPELASLRKAGALTLAQDGESSTVHGMPGAAIRLGGAGFVLSPASMGELIDRSARR